MKSIKMTFIALALSTSVVGAAFAAGANDANGPTNNNGAQADAQTKSSTTTDDPTTPGLRNHIPQGDACSTPDPVNSATKCAPAPGAKQ